MSALKAPHLVESPLPATGSILGPRIQVLSWNVHKETETDFVDDLERLIDAGNIDIVLLQEAGVAEDSSPVLRTLRDRHWALSANLADRAKRMRFGVLVASRARPIETRALLSQGVEPILGTAKPALLTRYAIGSDTLTVVNIHALNFSPRLDGFRQQISQIAGALGNTTGPVLVGGDFNSWSARKSFLVDSILGESGLVAVDFGEQGSKRTTAFGRPLDHIYYTPRFLTIDTTRIHVHDSIRSSDHVPIEVGFRLNPAGILPVSPKPGSGLDAPNPDMSETVPSF
jgi:endonuclease/exonuclease/phosphatase (EEP) superfamily protein YafD